MIWIKRIYFDASALVKLVLVEDRSAEVQAYAKDNEGHLYTNSICVAEAYNVLKRKWLGKEKSLDVNTYCAAVNQLTRVRGNGFYLDDVELLSVQDDVERLIRKYADVGSCGIDMSDALQLVTIRKEFRHGNSVLVTADNKLAQAAKAEDLQHWNCNEPPPGPWSI